MSIKINFPKKHKIIFFFEKVVIVGFREFSGLHDDTRRCAAAVVNGIAFFRKKRYNAMATPYVPQPISKGGKVINFDFRVFFPMCTDS